MKVNVNCNPQITETTVDISCCEQSKNITRLKEYIEDFDSTIRVKDGTSLSSLKIIDVYYFEAVDNKTFAYTSDRAYEVDKRLYELEAILDKRYFFRCSKSLIVNVSKIEALRPELTRNIRATLTNGEVVIISRRFASEFKKLINSSEE